jgi:hypothetical protein
MAILIASVVMVVAGEKVTPVWATPPVKYVGSFQVTPQEFHPDVISGQMILSLSGGQVSGVTMNLDKPVFGHSSLSSGEQWSGTPGEGSAQELVVAFKLLGPPHPWYFVFVGGSVDGGLTEQGTIYRADAKLSDIQATAQSPITSAPAGWKSVGTATLKAQ